MFKWRGKSEEALRTPVEQIEGACPGQPGKVRIVYWPVGKESKAVETEWVDVDSKGDFIHQFTLADLQPGTTYNVRSETKVEGQPPHGAMAGTFRTAPTSNATAPVQFCVMTCQGYPDRDHVDGHPIYPSNAGQGSRFHFSHR